MNSKALLFAGILTLSLGDSARAQYITTNATLNLPGSPPPAAVTGVIHIDAGTNVGISYTNVFTTNLGNTPQVGDKIISVGTTLFGQGSRGNNPGSPFNFGTSHNIVATFAVQGTVTQVPPPAGQFTATFTQGVVKFYDLGTTGPTLTDPSTWTSGTELGTYILAYLNQNPNAHPAVTQGPQSGSNPPFGAAVNQTVFGQDTAQANLNTPFNSSNNFLFDRVNPSNSDLLVPNFPSPANIVADGIFENSNETILNAFTGGTGGLTSTTALNAVIALLLSGVPGVTIDPFTDGTPGGSFNPLAAALGTPQDPQGPNPNWSGDAIQSFGSTVYPVYLQQVQPPPPSVIPEPASLLLWAAFTAGFGVYGRARRNRKN